MATQPVTLQEAIEELCKIARRINFPQVLFRPPCSWIADSLLATRGDWDELEKVFRKSQKLWLNREDPDGLYLAVTSTGRLSIKGADREEKPYQEFLKKADAYLATVKLQK